MARAFGNELQSAANSAQALGADAHHDHRRPRRTLGSHSSAVFAELGGSMSNASSISVPESSSYAGNQEVERQRRFSRRRRQSASGAEDSPSVLLSPTKSLSSMLARATVNSPAQRHWASRRRLSDINDLTWHRPFQSPECKTSVRMPDGEKGSRLIVALAPTHGPYAVHSPSNTIGPFPDGESWSSVQSDSETGSQTCQPNVIFGDYTNDDIGELQRHFTTITSKWMFEVVIPDEYPFKPPSVRCCEPARLYHPLCVPEYSSSNSVSSVHADCFQVLLPSLLDWAPTRRLADVISWLQDMLLDPSSDLSEAPNTEAAQTLKTNPSLFHARVIHCAETERNESTAGCEHRWSDRKRQKSSVRVSNASGHSFRSCQKRLRPQNTVSDGSEFSSSSHKRFECSKQNNSIHGGAHDDFRREQARGAEDGSLPNAQLLNCEDPEGPRKKVRVFRNVMVNSAGYTGMNFGASEDHTKSADPTKSDVRPSSKVRRVLLGQEVSNNSVVACDTARVAHFNSGQSEPALTALKMALNSSTDRGLAEQTRSHVNSSADGGIRKKRLRL